MSRVQACMDSWAPMTLCWCYFSAYVEQQQVQLRAADEPSRELAVTWAVGVLADGDWEALGAWPGAASGSAFRRGIWEDLDARGVDRISLVCSSDLEARALCPAGKVLPSFQQILGVGYVPAGSGTGLLRAEARRVVREASGVRAARAALERLLAKPGAGRAAVLSPDWPELLEQFRAFYALRPHRRALVRAGDEHVEQLGLGLRRAVGRHGPFADLAAAVSFVAQTISREERRLKSCRLSRVAQPSLRLVRPDVAGLASLGR